MIIGLTGNAMDDDVQLFLHAGADEVLVKPLKAEQLDEIFAHLQINGFDTIIDKQDKRFSFSRRGTFLIQDPSAAKYEFK